MSLIKYYNFDDLPLVKDTDLVGLTPTAKGVISGWSSFLTDKILSKVPKVGEILSYEVKVLLGNSLAEAQTVIFYVSVNDKSEVSIAGSAFSVLSQSALAVAITKGAFGLAGLAGAKTLLGGVVVAGAIAFTWAAFGDLYSDAMTSIIDFGFGLGDEVDIKFLDSNDEHVSGVFYPDGLDGTANEKENAVVNFIVKAGEEIQNGGKVVFEGQFFDDEFFIHNATDYLLKIVAFSSATNIDEFLDINGSFNRDHHVFKGNKNYLFFEDNEIRVDIPVIIDGVQQVYEVNNIYKVYNGDELSDSNRVLGNDGLFDGYNLIIGIGTGIKLTLNGSEDNDIILGGNQNDIIFGDDGDDVIASDSNSYANDNNILEFKQAA